MKILVLTLALASAGFTAAPAIADPSSRFDRVGDRAERVLDRHGNRIERRLDYRADRVRDQGRGRLANRLERAGNRADRRFDRHGDRLNRRIDRAGRRRAGS